jgi:hypothetical protein
MEDTVVSGANIASTTPGISARRKGACVETAAGSPKPRRVPLLTTRAPAPRITAVFALHHLVVCVCLPEMQKSGRFRKICLSSTCNCTVIAQSNFWGIITPSPLPASPPPQLHRHGSIPPAPAAVCGATAPSTSSERATHRGTRLPGGRGSGEHRSCGHLCCGCEIGQQRPLHLSR